MSDDRSGELVIEQIGSNAARMDYTTDHPVKPVPAVGSGGGPRPASSATGSL